MIESDYLDTLEKRVQSNKIVKEFQDTALMLADMLDDKPHIALYMKLAQKCPKRDLLRVAKDVAGRAHVKHKGAYFMKVLKEEGILKWTKKIYK